jgi:MoaA/NifB/PqqE/SkfB family radical SAM enzyme
MQIDTVENALLSITINPLLGFLMSCSNNVCPRVSELDKTIGLAKQLGARFMHFNYIPTGQAKAYVELDLTPDQRLQALGTIGKEIIRSYLVAKEEELKYGKSNVKVAKFFSTCPQYARDKRAFPETR